MNARDPDVRLNRAWDKTRAPSDFQIIEAQRQLEEARDQLLAMDADMPEDQKLWVDMLEGQAIGDPVEIVERLFRAAIDAEVYAQAASERADEILARARRFTAQREKYRALAKSLLETLRLRSFMRPDFDVSVFTPKFGRVVVPDVEHLDPNYVEVTKKARLADARAALMAGKEVYGAYLSNPEPVMQVKRR